MAKIIVIGAGVGGLAAAARLAKTGHTIQIIEASDRVGGKARTEWIGDYAFDTGPSLLTLPAVYRDLFLKTGKRIEHILKIDPVDPAFSYQFADKTEILFPNLSLKATCDSIEKSIGKCAADDWHNLMQRAEAMWDVSRGPFVESELTSILPLLKSRTFFRDLAMIAPFSSMRKLTKKYTTDPYLSKIIDRYATYTGSDPRKAPAVLLTIAFVESAFGAWHIQGGIGKLPIALAERCAELGVEITLNTEVVEILQDGTKATGVKTNDGRELSADIVIANADAQYVYNKLLPASLTKVSKERRKLRRATPSLAGFSLLLGLDNSKLSHTPTRLAHHSIFFPEDYDQEFIDVFEAKRPVLDPTIYICSPNDPAMVRNGDKEAWFVLVNAPRHDPKNGLDWRKDPESYAKKIINRLDELGLEVSPRLDVMEFRTPFDLENSVKAPGGSIYGTSSNSARSAFLRASNRSPLKDLYCVGGSAHPGGGLPLVGISAEIVADAIGSAS